MTAGGKGEMKREIGKSRYGPFREPNCLFWLIAWLARIGAGHSASGADWLQNPHILHLNRFASGRFLLTGSAGIELLDALRQRSIRSPPYVPDGTQRADNPTGAQ